MSATFREVYPALDESVGFLLHIEARELRSGDLKYSVYPAHASPPADQTVLPKIIPPPFYLPIDSELRMHIERGRLVVEIFKRV